MACLWTRADISKKHLQGTYANMTYKPVCLVRHPHNTTHRKHLRTQENAYIRDATIPANFAVSFRECPLHKLRVQP